MPVSTAITPKTDTCILHSCPSDRYSAQDHGSSPIVYNCYNCITTRKVGDMPAQLGTQVSLGQEHGKRQSDHTGSVSRRYGEPWKLQLSRFEANRVKRPIGSCIQWSLHGYGLQTVVLSQKWRLDGEKVTSSYLATYRRQRGFHTPSSSYTHRQPEWVCTRRTQQGCGKEKGSKSQAPRR